MLFVSSNYFKSTLFIKYLSIMNQLQLVCQEMLASDMPMQKRFLGHHHWSAIAGRKQLQATTCAICGQYQNVGSTLLYDILIEKGTPVFCNNEEHFDFTNEKVVEEDHSIPHELWPYYNEDIEYSDAEIDSDAETELGAFHLPQEVENSDNDTEYNDDTDLYM